MTRQLISSGSTFEQEIGYSRAVVDDDCELCEAQPQLTLSVRHPMQHYGVSSRKPPRLTAKTTK